MTLTKVTSGLISADASSVDLNIDAGTLYIDATNNRVGVGNTSPNSYSASANNLVVGSSGDTGITIVSSTVSNGQLKFADGTTGDATGRGIIDYNHASDHMALKTAATERMRIDSSGNVGIGITNATAKIGKGNGYAGNTSATASGYLDLYNGNDGNTYLYNTGAFALTFGTNNTERMRIDSSGNVLVGTATSEARITVKSSGSTSSTNAINVDNSSGTELFYIRDDGAFRTGSGSVSPYNNTAAVTANVFVNTDGTLLRATSSSRYKKDIVDARFGLSDVLKLRPVNYKGNNLEVDGDIIYGGLIAEEVHDAGLTEFVEYNKENQPDALRYQHMVSLCIKAIQEQQAQIKALQSEINLLKGE